MVETLENVVTVPTAAIQRGAPGTYVYVINADSTVSVQQIKTGVVDGNLTEVKSGLTPGKRVVIDGTDRLRDGLRVSVAPEAGQAAGAAPAQGGKPAGQRRQNSGNAQTKPANSGQ